MNDEERLLAVKEVEELLLNSANQGKIGQMMSDQDPGDPLLDPNDPKSCDSVVLSYEVAEQVARVGLFVACRDGIITDTQLDLLRGDGEGLSVLLWCILGVPQGGYYSERVSALRRAHQP